MYQLVICLLITTASSLADNKALDKFTTANNIFAGTVYKEIIKNEKGNFLVSPFSAETVLAFAQSGCKDETAQEIRSALHLPDSQEEVEAAIRNFLPRVKNNEHYSLHTANKRYIKKDHPINKQFKKTAGEVYQAESENIDFSKKIEAAEKINSWVEKNTNNKIHNLVQPDTFNNRSRVVLLNALYFKADWSTPFFLSSTNKQNFYKSENEVVEVDTMHHYSALKHFFNFRECSKLKAKFLELPFKGEDATMTVVLPNEREGLAALENQIEKVLAPHDYSAEIVNVALPKFKIESRIDLKEVLQELGVKKAFDGDYADLSGISGKKGDLVVDKVAQKSFIDVSEKGVEAAAATFVLVGVPMSGFIDPPKDFVADHPFIFYIKISDVIVFVGRVTDPE